MKQFAYYIIYLLTCIGAVSCVETIVMDPHEEMPAVVYCVLTNKSDVQTLDLSAAESPSGVKPEMKAKEVVVWAGSRERYVFQNAGGTKWTARFRPVPLEKYSLHVTLEGGGELVAETTFPDTVAINDHYEEGGVISERGFDRVFDERADLYSIAETRYSSNTRQYGFKLMEPTYIPTTNTVVSRMLSQRKRKKTIRSLYGRSILIKGPVIYGLPPAARNVRKSSP